MQIKFRNNKNPIVIVFFIIPPVLKINNSQESIESS